MKSYCLPADVKNISTVNSVLGGGNAVRRSSFRQTIHEQPSHGRILHLAVIGHGAGEVKTPREVIIFFKEGKLDSKLYF